VPSFTDYFYHTDDNYNVTAITDESGAVVERYEYGDFGAVCIYDANGIEIPQSAVGNRYYFTGREYDPETGLYHYRTRYYDAIVGRFISRDMIGIWGDPYESGNPYSYVGNNPWTFTDPYGFQAGGGGSGGSSSAAVLAAQVAEAVAKAKAAIAAVKAGTGSVQAASAAIAAAAALMFLLAGEDAAMDLQRELQKALDKARQPSPDPSPKSKPKPRPRPIDPDLWPDPGNDGDRPPNWAPPNSHWKQKDGCKERWYGPDGYPSRDVEPSTPTQPSGPDGRHYHDWGRPPGGGPPSHKDRGPPKPYIPPGFPDATPRPVSGQKGPIG
jgi:RHS repeat-associated protein